MGNEANQPLIDWLNEYSNKRSKANATMNFNIYLAWAKKTPKQLVDEFDQIKTKSQILQFQSYLVNDFVSEKTKDKLKPNTVRAVLTAVRAFYSSQKEQIRGLKGKIIDSQMAQGEHPFSIDDLRSMYSVANLRDKAILSTAVSLGWETSAFLGLDKIFIEKLVLRAKSQNVDFIAFDWQRHKSGAPQFGILNPMALFSLENYLAKLTKENPDQKRLFDLSEPSTNDVIRKLAKDSNLTLIGTIHFHLLRKFLMNALNDAGLNSFETKFIVGKKIGISDQTYLQGLKKNAFEKYQKAYPEHLSLSQHVNGAAKYSVLTDLVIQHVKAQEALIGYMKSNNMLEHLPQPIQEQLNSVYEFAKKMEGQNGTKDKKDNDCNE
jgi:hypothetical protein